MAEDPTPTYRVERGEDEDRFVCLIPDAGQPGGVCGMVSRTLEYMTDHMQQRHSGLMVAEHDAEEDAPSEPTEADDEGELPPASAVTAEADPISTPRTPDSQEAPPRGAPTPTPPPAPPAPPPSPSEETPASDAAGEAA